MNNRDGLRAGGAEDLREQPMGELFKQLSADMSELVRQELQLAQAELTMKGKQAGVGIGMFGAAGLVGLFALGCLTACFIAALGTGMSVWLAALIVAVVYAAIAGVVALMGLQNAKKGLPPKPEQTIETVKEDVQWAKTQMPSGSR